MTTDADVTVITDGLEFPEGPVWMDDGSVLVAELMGKRVTRVAPDGTKTTVAEPGGSPNGLAIGPDGACRDAGDAGCDAEISARAHVGSDSKIEVSHDCT